MRRSVVLSTVMMLSCSSGSHVTSSGGSGGGGRTESVATTYDSDDGEAEESPSPYRKETVEIESTKSGGAAMDPPRPSRERVDRSSRRRAKKKKGRTKPPVGLLGDASAGRKAGPPPKVHVPRSPPPPPPLRRPAKSPGVKAGASDDNLQFSAFLRFVSDNQHLGLAHDVTQRVIVEVVDQDERPIPDVDVEILSRQGGVIGKRRTYADGRTMVFPTAMPAYRAPGTKIRIRHAGESKSFPLATIQRHKIRAKFAAKRKAEKKVPLDIVFIMDTTGSMDDEIAQLKETLGVINFQVSSLRPRPDVRFGMVSFRDVEDDYLTQIVPLTGDVAAFQRKLSEVEAGGGGDTPEDVQAGLQAAMTQMRWRDSGIKLAFLIGDAPPHLDYGQSYTYVSAMRDAAKKAIKIATIGASGLDRRGEMVWRQIAQYTMAPFVFLTYGEKGDSEGGTPSAVSHHVGSNWVAENLDAIIIRMVKVEMAHYGVKPVEQRLDYFEARPIAEMGGDRILEELFSKSVRQLVDYSVTNIEQRTPTVVLPINVDEKKLAIVADKLSVRLSLGLSRAPQFQLLASEKKDILKTIAEQLSEEYDEGRVIEAGKLVSAKLAVLSKLEPGKGGKAEMLVKLIRLETGEVLSLSLLKIDRTLL